MNSLLINRYGARGAGTPVNAYIIEAPDGVVVIDATLTVSDGRALRGQVDATGKPLLGVVITHTHPDHYGGLAELLRGLEVAAFATRGVDAAIRRDDSAKEAVLRPMFGDEWASERVFPSEHVADGETLRFGDIALTVTDLGPGESPHDSIWALEGNEGRTVFSADVAYDRRHCYLADGFHEEWLANIARIRGELPAGTTLHPGHGEPCGLEVLDWQERYIELLLAGVREADWSDPDAARSLIAARMRKFLPTEELAFLMELSVDPLAAQLAGSAGEAR